MSSNLLFLITIYIKYSLLYYTFYGITKSFIEYSCIQKRPDKVDFVSVQNDIYTLNMTGTKNPKYLGSSLMNLDGEFYLFNRKETDYKKCGEFNCKYYPNYKVITKSIEEKFEMEYKINDNHFYLSCSGRNVIFGKNLFLGNYSKKNEFYINNEGYFSFIRTPSVLYGVMGLHDEYRTDCVFRKAPSTCSIKNSTQNGFVSLYISTTLLLLLLCLIREAKFKRQLIKRALYYIIFFFCNDPLTGIKFCNPINGEPCMLRSGTRVNSFEGNISSPFAQEEDEGEIDILYDMDGEYRILDGKVHIRIKNVCSVIEYCPETILKNVRKYFYCVYKDPNNCAVNVQEKRFLRTSEVISKLISGGVLKKEVINSDEYILDVEPFDLKKLEGMFKIGFTHCGALLEHNFRFFKGKNTEAMDIALLKGGGWADRPKDVNNSQWKLYTSDIYHYLKKNCGRRIFRQVKWNESATMKGILKEFEEGKFDSYEKYKKEGEKVIEISKTTKKNVIIKEHVCRKPIGNLKIDLKNSGSDLKIDLRDDLTNAEDKESSMEQIIKQDEFLRKDLLDEIEKTEKTFKEVSLEPFIEEKVIIGKEEIDHYKILLKKKERGTLKNESETFSRYGGLEEVKKMADDGFKIVKRKNNKGIDELKLLNKRLKGIKVFYLSLNNIYGSLQDIDTEEEIEFHLDIKEGEIIDLMKRKGWKDIGHKGKKKMKKSKNNNNNKNKNKNKNNNTGKEGGGEEGKGMKGADESLPLQIFKKPRENKGRNYSKCFYNVDLEEVVECTIKRFKKKNDKGIDFNIEGKKRPVYVLENRIEKFFRKDKSKNITKFQNFVSIGREHMKIDCEKTGRIKIGSEVVREINELMEKISGKLDYLNK